MYRCVATSLDGFIQQIAVAYVSRGYCYFVLGRVPKGKSAELVDQKLMRLYGVDISKWARARRKAKGLANVQYLRFEDTWVLLASQGTHETFFRDQANALRDSRETPLRFAGYAISYRNRHASVRLDLAQYQVLKSYFVERAKHRRRETIEAELRSLPFIPFAPIRRQILSIFRAMNKARRAAGFQELSKWCLRLAPRSVKVFESGEASRLVA